MDIQEIIKENQELKVLVTELQEKLKKYTNPDRNKKYYENNKAEHKQRVKEYQQKTNYKSDYKPTPEQKKEYNKREYLKRKEKLKKGNEEKTEN